MWSPMADEGITLVIPLGFDISTENWGNYTPRGLPIGNPGNPRMVLEKATLARRRDRLRADLRDLALPTAKVTGSLRDPLCPYRLHPEQRHCRLSCPSANCRTMGERVTNCHHAAMRRMAVATHNCKRIFCEQIFHPQMGGKKKRSTSTAKSRIDFAVRCMAASLPPDCRGIFCDG